MAKSCERSALSCHANYLDDRQDGVKIILRGNASGWVRNKPMYLWGTAMVDLNNEGLILMARSALAFSAVGKLIMLMRLNH